MDEIDKLKIGKKDEKLVGWDFIRKPKLPGSNLPPMRARGAKEKYRQGFPRHPNINTDWFWIIVILGAIGIIIAKFLKLW